MKIISTLFGVVSMCIVALVAQQSLAQELLQDLAPDDPLLKKYLEWKAQSEAKAPVGSIAKKPIVLEGFKTYKEVKEKQREYIQPYREEGYTIFIDQFAQEDNEHFIQSFVLSDGQGKYIEIYFDITDICKSARRLKDAYLLRRMKAAKEFREREPERKLQAKKYFQESLEEDKKLQAEKESGKSTEKDEKVEDSVDTEK